jgi:hypothetical protein
LFPTNEVPFLLALLIGLLLGLVTSGLLRNRIRRAAQAEPSWCGGTLPAMLVLAIFTLGVFLTYALLGPK